MFIYVDQLLMKYNLWFSTYELPFTQESEYGENTTYKKRHIILLRAFHSTLILPFYQFSYYIQKLCEFEVVSVFVDFEIL